MNEKKTDEQVISIGLKALFDTLGPVDAIRFVHICDGICGGDYTEERRQILEKENEIKEMENGIV